VLELEKDEEGETVGLHWILGSLVFLAWFDDSVQAFPSVIYSAIGA